VPVGCGKCIECRKQNARNWQVRLQEEVKIDKTGKFVTLSFNDDSLDRLADSINFDEEGIEKKDKLTGYELDNAIATLAIRRYLERWRKKFKKISKTLVYNRIRNKKNRKITHSWYNVHRRNRGN
jgi:hypothetical protein